MIKKSFCLSLLCLSAYVSANIVSHPKLAQFIKKQKKTSNRYKDKPLALISSASKLLGYGSISKDDLYLLDRMPKNEHDIKKLIEQFPVDEAVTQERLRRWKQEHYKRADVIKELRRYTAQQCGCSAKQAYAWMRDRSKVDDHCYFATSMQNLHDLYMFKKTIE